MLPAFLAISGAFMQATPLASQTPAQTPATTPVSTAPATPLSKKDEADEKQHEANIASDIAQGLKASAEVEKQFKLSTNQEYQARVQRIGAEIAAIANAGPHWNVLWGDHHLSKFTYTYKVLKSDDVNAFSLPGGHIYVYEGLMNQIESDDELAGVLGHETAHAAFRHVATLEHDSEKVNMITLPLILASLLVGGGAAASTIVPLASLGGQTIASGWSVRAEEAADYGGMQFLIKSKYDPTGMLTFMERLAAEEKLGPNIDWGIYRDHPPSEERADTLTRYITQAGLPIRRSHVTTSFRVTLHPSDNGTVQLDFGTRPIVAFGGSEALTRADVEVPLLNSFFDSSPELYEVQAGPGGNLLWRGRPLLTLTKEDADAAGLPMDQFQQKTLHQFQIAMFNLGFHVWSTH
jgi:predicted Zn-dependent protease